MTSSNDQRNGERDFDIVVFGATGFTGRQAAHYLANHRDRERFTFAIAARSQAKLDRLSTELADAPGPPNGVLVGDALDGAAMDRIAERCHIVLTTAGPFAKYGNELVRACVEARTHYVDITGETPWVRTVIDRFHDRAKLDGTRIIPFCGYDSIPSDIGALYAAQQLETTTGRKAARVEAFHRGKGGINGGTVASLVNMQREGKTELLNHPFLLDPEPSDDKALLEENRDPRAPFYSSRARAWAGPFFMGAINTRVVRRSYALLQDTPVGESLFDDRFSYQEYWKAEGAFGFAEASAMATMQGMTNLSGKLGLGSNLIEWVAPDPGEGPSEATMDGGFFSCDLYAIAPEAPDKDDEPASAHVRLSGKGDPGNRITIKCLCESALLLALGQDQLPTQPGGGVLTSASGLGLALVPRLERSAPLTRQQSEVSSSVERSQDRFLSRTLGTTPDRRRQCRPRTAWRVDSSEAAVMRRLGESGELSG